MNNFPRNRHELERARYRKTGDGICKGCSAPIEWWKTTNNRSIPMNPMLEDSSEAKAHFSTCPNARDFHGTDSNTPAERPRKIGPSPDEELRRLRASTNARVIVMIDEFGTAASWRTGIPAEDLRHDLISAANFVRNEVNKKEGQPV